MPDEPGNSGRRLDSWKTIAAYLGRDERTVQRWERQFGLPVRRLQGGRGASVYAFAVDLDAWLTANPPAYGAGHASQAPPSPVTAPSEAGEAWLALPRRRWLVGTAAVVVLTAGGFGVRALYVSATAANLTVAMTSHAVVARDADGHERWQHRFPGQRVEPPQERQRHPIERLDTRGSAFVGATGLQVSMGDEVVSGGRLFSLTAGGKPEREFSFDDGLAFGAGTYRRPWGITDFRLDHRAGNRIALAAHHFEWWPSMVTVLDDHWQRQDTFVHAGWLERVHWQSPDRLLVGGFSEPFDGGVVALLDAGALNGQPPVPADSPFYCTRCGGDRPVRYVVMPRSEVNRASASRFNRARLEIHPDRIVVRTTEAAPSETDVAEALYEFTPSLDLVSASFSDRYWGLHAALEREGRLDHPRERCPDRDGPPGIRVWEPHHGWHTEDARH